MQAALIKSDMIGLICHGFSFFRNRKNALPTRPLRRAARTSHGRTAPLDETCIADRKVNPCLLAKARSASNRAASQLEPITTTSWPARERAMASFRARGFHEREAPVSTAILRERTCMDVFFRVAAALFVL